MYRQSFTRPIAPVVDAVARQLHSVADGLDRDFPRAFHPVAGTPNILRLIADDLIHQAENAMPLDQVGPEVIRAMTFFALYDVNQPRDCYGKWCTFENDFNLGPLDPFLQEPQYGPDPVKPVPEPKAKVDYRSGDYQDLAVDRARIATLESLTEAWMGTKHVNRKNKLAGPNSTIHDGGDCTGSSWKIYGGWGVSYGYTETAKFEESADNGQIPFRKLVPDEPKQIGDAVIWPGHMGIYAGNEMAWSLTDHGFRKHSLKEIDPEYTFYRPRVPAK